MSKLINSEVLEAKKEALELFYQTVNVIETVTNHLLNTDKLKIESIVGEVNMLDELDFNLYQKSKLKDLSIDNYILIRKLIHFIVSLEGYILEDSQTIFFEKIKNDAEYKKAIKEGEVLLKYCN